MPYNKVFIESGGWGGRGGGKESELFARALATAPPVFITQLNFKGSAWATWLALTSPDHGGSTPSPEQSASDFFLVNKERDEKLKGLGKKKKECPQNCVEA